MHTPTPKTSNVFSRFIDIWKPSFLSLLEKEEKNGKSWGFWFLWSTIFAVIVTGFIGHKTVQFAEENEPKLWNELPEFNFVFKDHKLIETGLEEPFRKEYHSDESDLNSNFVFIIDRSGKSYDESSLNALPSAILINEDVAYIKDESKNQIQTMPFSDIPELADASFDKPQLQEIVNEIKPTIMIVGSIILFIGLWIWIAALRLISNLWWALMCWLFFLSAGIKNLNFGKSYLFVLNISFIPFLFDLILMATGMSIPFFSLTLFGIITGMNIYDQKQNIKKS